VRVRTWPLGAVPLDGVTTSAIEGATNQCGSRQWIEQQRDKQDEIPNHVIVLGAQQGRQIFDRPQVSLDLPVLALDSGLLDLQVGEGR
jgi:hypothetical protein